MESAATALTVMGGLGFSLACAILLEELIFGGLFRLFFAPRPGHPRNEQNPGRQN